uniref:Uncharacterized protein n=1 Tax=Paramormyrops kingsleyae TaxID=1676925 RepID=A0A3B3Q7L9_9TELE
MASLVNPHLIAALEAWCHEVNVDPNTAVAVSGVPDDMDITDIETVVEAVKVFGRVRLRARRFFTQINCEVILCECRNAFEPERVPPEIVPPQGGAAWKLMVIKGGPSADAFSAKLLKLLESEGKTADDVQSLLFGARNPQPEDTPASIIRAVGDLLEKTMKPTHENNAFRRLRILSGILPTPAGEETLDNWLEQARLMLDECDCSLKEKRKRIVESLKGPALEVVQAVRCNDPCADPEDYLTALENVFGTSESGDDVYITFRQMHQHSGERLSDFLIRLEKCISRAVQKGGIQQSMRDQARVEQLLRGTTESDIMLLKLRLKERRNSPPTFITLLNEIREEEGQETARQKVKFTSHGPVSRAGGPKHRWDLFPFEHCSYKRII